MFITQYFLKWSKEKTYYLGQTTKIIAEAFGLKINTIDKKISRGLVKLRETVGGVLLDG